MDRIIPGLTELLHQAGMRWHPAHPLLAPLRAIDHLRQVFVQNASLRIDSYGDQWLRTIPPAASRLLQSAAGKQLRRRHGTNTLLLRQFSATRICCPPTQR